MLKKFILIAVYLILSFSIHAQDFGFGFGFSDDEDSGYSVFSGAGFSAGGSVVISGEVSAAIVGYFNEMAEGAEHINTRDMFLFSGKLNFLVQSQLAKAVINLKLVPALVPVSIDEAYIGVFYGGFDLSAGLKKVAWGKADQFGPLDILNMPDASRMFIEMADNSNLMGVKLANPMIHATYRFGQHSKIEGIFLPSFEIVSMAVSSMFSGSNEMLALVSGPISNKWLPSDMKNLLLMYPKKSDGSINYEGIFIPVDTSGLDYTQAGLRFTTTIGSVDLGMQYFYGRMIQPVVKPDIDGSGELSINLYFNKYHQIGFDYAQVLAGFNVRAEVAANITEDLKGDDGLIYNPSIGWSLGFDRDLVAGINLNFQANGTVRLFNNNVGVTDFSAGHFDIESGSSLTATRITAMLSKKFLRDELELRTAVVWGIEDRDAAVIPALIWTRDDFRAAFSGGFFLGNKEGQLGQYKDNNFLKISITYVF